MTGEEKRRKEGRKKEERRTYLSGGCGYPLPPPLSLSFSSSI